MSGKDTYDERKRLESENALLREQNQNKMLKQAAARIDLDGLAIAAFTSILNGSAAIVATPGHAGGFVINFNMPSQITADDNQPF